MKKNNSNNYQCDNLNFCENELIIEDGEKSAPISNRTKTSFDDLTLDEITFSSTDNKDVPNQIQENLNDIRKEINTDTAEDLKRQKQNEDFFKEMEKELDEILKRILSENNQTEDN